MKFERLLDERWLTSSYCIFSWPHCLLKMCTVSPDLIQYISNQTKHSYVCRYTDDVCATFTAGKQQQKEIHSSLAVQNVKKKKKPVDTFWFLS